MTKCSLGNNVGYKKNHRNVIVQKGRVTWARSRLWLGLGGDTVREWAGWAGRRKTAAASNLPSMRFEGNRWPQRLQSPTLLELRRWLIGVGWIVGWGGVRGTPDTPEWSHGFTFLRRQLCRKGSWVCVWVSMSAQWRLEEKSKMKEGNEIYCPYALGEWREAVWVKLIRVAECQRQYSTAEKVSDTFAFCTPLKNHKVTTELVWAEAMFLWPYWQSVVLTLQLASSQWPP